MTMTMIELREKYPEGSQVQIKGKAALEALAANPKCDSCRNSIVGCGGSGNKNNLHLLGKGAGDKYKVAEHKRYAGIPQIAVIPKWWADVGSKRSNRVWIICEHTILAPGEEELTGLALAAKDPKAYMAMVKKNKGRRSE